MVDEESDPVNYEFEFRKLRVDTISMADRAALEIRKLRAQIQSLAAGADAYETIKSILRLQPLPSQNYEEDFAHRLERRANELREGL